QAEDGIRDFHVTGVQTCALPISERRRNRRCCPFWCTSSVPAGQLACPDALSLTHDPKQRGLKLLARTVHLRKGLVETLEFLTARSEERRVGKGWRSRGVSDHEKT